MAVVIHKRGHSWDVSACDCRAVKLQPLAGRFNLRWLSLIENVTARGTIQLVMIMAMLRGKRSWDDSIRDGCLGSTASPLVNDSACHDDRDVHMLPLVR